MTNSLDVAKLFGRRHDNILRDIGRLHCSAGFHALNFEEMKNEVRVGKGATRLDPSFNMTKDGFVFLVMGFKGAEAARFKEAYIARFNEMEAELRKPLAPSALASQKLVTFHARSMLLEAKRAGDALIVVKGMVKHGEFKAWVEKHCRCSYQSANRYMKVAQLGHTKNLNLETFEGGLVAFLEAHSTPRKAPAEPAPTFDRAEAEYALKLHRMATSAVQVSPSPILLPHAYACQ